MSNQTLRILTGLVGGVGALAVIYLGGHVFNGVVLLVILLTQREMYGVMEAKGLAPVKSIGLLLGAVICAYLFWEHWVLALGLGLLALPIVYLVQPPDRVLESLSGTVFGLIYPTACLSFLFPLRTLELPDVPDAGLWLTLFLFLFIWANDTFAYFTGKRFGKRPLAPTISPKKTWEGFLGGALGTLLFAVIGKFWGLAFLSWFDVLALAVLCSTFGPIGDLMESQFKRGAGLKDSSTLLPGHGGLLDRFDALALATPAVYLYIFYQIIG